MTQSTHHIAPGNVFVSGDTTPVSAPEPDLAELEHQGRRLAEDLEGLKRTRAYYASVAEGHEAAVVELTEKLEHVTSTGRAGPAHTSAST